MYVGRAANFVYGRWVLLLQPKTEDSSRLKIHFLYNNVGKNVLKTSDASCLCEKGVNINDKRLSNGSLWQCSNSTVYLQLSAIKIPKKIVVFSCDRPGY